MKALLLVCVLLSCVLAVTPATVAAVEAKPQELQETNQLVDDQVVVPKEVEDEMLPAGQMLSPEARFFTCPSGWVRYKNKCYQYVSSGRSWSSAVAFCNSLGATLASVQDVFDYSFLQDLTAGSGGSAAWIGGFYFQDWRWLDQSSFTYTYWGTQSSASSYPCMYLNVRGGWSNNNCNTGYTFICMRRTDTC